MQLCGHLQKASFTWSHLPLVFLQSFWFFSIFKENKCARHVFEHFQSSDMNFGATYPFKYFNNWHWRDSEYYVYVLDRRKHNHKYVNTFKNFDVYTFQKNKTKQANKNQFWFQISKHGIGWQGLFLSYTRLWFNLEHDKKNKWKFK